MLWESAFLISASLAYMLLNEDNTPGEDTKLQEESNNFNDTFNYWKELPVKYQIDYASYNYYLQPYADELSLENTYLNAYRVAKIADKLNRSFTNINSRYN